MCECAHAEVHAGGVRGQPAGVHSVIHHVGPRNQIQVISFGSKYLDPLSHPSIPWLCYE